MKKQFIVKAYEAFDLTKVCPVTDEPVESYDLAECAVNRDDAIYKKRCQNSKFRPYGRVVEYKRHDYVICRVVGKAELEVEDDDYEPTFYELCEAVEDWQDGEYCKPYEFED